MATPLTAAELRLAAMLLEMAGEQFSNHGCNDLKIENTPENAAVVRACDLAGGWDEDVELPATQDGATIYANDADLMRYLAGRLREVAQG